MTLVARLFRLLVHHVVVARGPNRLALKSAKRANVGDQLPDLVVRESSPEGGHSVGPPFRNRRKDVLRLTAVYPIVVGERGTDASSTVRVAPGTVHLIEQALPLGHGVRVVVVRPLEFGMNYRRSGLQLTQDDGVLGRTLLLIAESPGLALTAHSRSGNEQRSRSDS